MTIQGYNADSKRAIGKIRLKCQLADLKSEITCYVIYNDTPNAFHKKNENTFRISYNAEL